MSMTNILSLSFLYSWESSSNCKCYAACASVRSECCYGLHVGVAATVEKSESCPSVDISVELFAQYNQCRDFWRNFAVDNNLPTGSLGGRLHLNSNLNSSYFVPTCITILDTNLLSF